MKFAGIIATGIGITMLVQWGFFLLTGQVPEVQSEPVRLGFHLAAEALTALGLIVSGIGLLRKTGWSRTAAFVSFGMLIYTVIVSPGYFAQQGVWALVGMFLVLLVLASVSVVRLARSE